jgi:hypothetical protein
MSLKMISGAWSFSNNKASSFEQAVWVGEHVAISLISNVLYELQWWSASTQDPRYFA